MMVRFTQPSLRKGCPTIRTPGTACGPRRRADSRLTHRVSGSDDRTATAAGPGNQLPGSLRSNLKNVKRQYGPRIMLPSAPDLPDNKGSKAAMIPNH
eukprot:680777-Hanusia_phi.AAC.2